jgi:NADH:ubiquinone oxidoreductase subunit K
MPASTDLNYWLLLAALLFSIGLYGVVTRRSAIGVLISVEVMLAGAALNFVAFNHFIAPATIDGQIMTLFVISVAAAEVVIAMAILVALFRYRGTTDVAAMNLMRD